MAPAVLTVVVYSANLPFPAESLILTIGGDEQYSPALFIVMLVTTPLVTTAVPIAFLPDIISTVGTVV